MMASVMSKRSNNGPKALISLVLRSTAHCPRTTLLTWSMAANTCTALPSRQRAPREVLPSKANTDRPVWAGEQAASHADTASSGTSGSTRCRTRRIVDSHGGTRPTPSFARSNGVRSMAHSAIAMNDLAPLRTAQAPRARIEMNLCRTPRHLRGSATALKASNSPCGDMAAMAPRRLGWRTAEGISEDTQADTAKAPGIVTDVENP